MRAGTRMMGKDPILHITRKLSMGILFVFSLLIALFLVYYSTKFSYYSSPAYDRPIYLIPDAPLKNLFFFCAVVAVSALLDHLFRKLPAKKQALAGYLFLAACCLFYAAACLVWATQHPYYPNGDQLNTTAGAYYNLEGNFVMLCEGGYIGKFPYQKGLMFFYEILFSLFGYFCYPVAAKFHIGMGVITMIFGYLFVEGTSKYSICKILYAPLVLFCAPYLILIPYAYGDLPSICFCTVLFWALLKFSKTCRARYAVLACVMASFSLLMRMHTWIALIAILIGMLLLAVQKKKLTPVIVGILIIASAVGSIKLLDYSYEIRSGYKSTKGAPMILTIAMGLQDNNDGPGTYNNYQSETLSITDFDLDAAKEIAMENISENLERFRNDHSYAVWFFKTKLQQQWLEPCFETLISTRSFKEEVPLPQWIFEIYYGKYHDPLTSFADRYQSIVYIGFLFFVLSLIKRQEETAAFYIPLITVTGGFLFSILWEAQCRYVLPYYLFMLLYVPDGILCAGRAIQRCLQQIKSTFPISGNLK